MMNKKIFVFTLILVLLSFNVSANFLNHSSTLFNGTFNTSSDSSGIVQSSGFALFDKIGSEFYTVISDNSFYEQNFITGVGNTKTSPFVYYNSSPIATGDNLYDGYRNAGLTTYFIGKDSGTVKIRKMIGSSKDTIVSLYSTSNHIDFAIDENKEIVYIIRDTGSLNGDSLEIRNLSNNYSSIVTYNHADLLLNKIRFVEYYNGLIYLFNTTHVKIYNDTTNIGGNLNFIKSDSFETNNVFNGYNPFKLKIFSGKIYTLETSSYPFIPSGYFPSYNLYLNEYNFNEPVNYNISINIQPSNIEINYNQIYRLSLENIFSNLDETIINFTFNGTVRSIINDVDNSYTVINNTFNNNNFSIYIKPYNNILTLTVESNTKDVYINDLVMTGSDVLNNNVSTTPIDLSINNTNIYLGHIDNIKNFPTNISLTKNTVKNYYLKDYYSSIDSSELYIACSTFAENDGDTPIFYILRNNLNGTNEVYKLENGVETLYTDTDSAISCGKFSVQLIESNNNFLIRFTTYDEEFTFDSQYVLNVFNSDTSETDSNNFYFSIQGENAGEILSFVDDIFPNSNTISNTSKFIRVILFLFATSMIFVLLSFVVRDDGGSTKLISTVGMLIIILEFMYFVMIGYIPVIVVIIIGLLSAGLFLLIFNKTGVTGG